MATSTPSSRLSQDEEGVDSTWADWHDHGKSPITVERRCTDVCCLLAHFLCMVALFLVLGYYAAQGNAGSFFKLRDWEGNPCGELGTGSEAKPFLFLCSAGGTNLNLQFPICIDECPNGTGQFVSCQSNETHRVLEPAYPTRIAFGDFCAPKFHDTNRNAQSREWLKQSHIVIPLALHNLRRARFCFVAGAVLTFFLSSFYVRSLQRLPAESLQCGMTLISIGCLTVGLHTIKTARDQSDSEEDRLSFFDPEVGQVLQYLAGFFLCMVGFSFMCTLCRKHRDIDHAELCLSSASECISDLPAFLLEPVRQVICRIFYMVAMVLFLLAILGASATTEDSGTAGTDYVVSWEQWISFAFLVFMTFWLLEMSGCFSAFVSSYIAQMWYLENIVDMADWGVADSSRLSCIQGSGLFCKAYRTALRYHLGSIAFGGFMGLVTSPLRKLLSPFSTSHEDDDINPVSYIMGRCCAFCVNLNERAAAFGKTSMIDLAMNGGPFCTSAFYTQLIINDRGVAAHVMSGASFIFVVIGFCIVAIVNFTLCEVVLTFFHHRISDQPIVNKNGVAATVALLASLTATPLFMVYDEVSDNALYVIALLNRRYGLTEPTPAEEIWETVTVPFKAFGTAIVTCGSTRQSSTPTSQRTKSKKSCPATAALVKRVQDAAQRTPGGAGGAVE